jgi:glyoxylase-like metal-dependent hydrolase (beta-lactamase superfamily II)
LLERGRASGKPLRTIINTQWQLDHAGGNATLREAFPLLRVMAGDADLATPDVVVVRERATVELAGLGLGIGVERGAITASDVCVYESNSQVLAAGDLVTLPVPLFTTACPERLADAIEWLYTTRFHWLVPGHGEPLGRGQFVIYRESFERLLRCAASKASHQCVDGWLRDAGGLFARDQQPMARTLLSRGLDEILRAPRDAQCKP